MGLTCFNGLGVLASFISDAYHPDIEPQIKVSFSE